MYRYKGLAVNTNVYYVTTHEPNWSTNTNICLVSFLAHTFILIIKWNMSCFTNYYEPNWSTNINIYQVLFLVRIFLLIIEWNMSCSPLDVTNSEFSQTFLNNHSYSCTFIFWCFRRNNLIWSLNLEKIWNDLDFMSRKEFVAVTAW